MANIVRLFLLGIVFLLIIAMIAWVIFSPDRVLQKYSLKTTLKQVKEEQIETIIKPYIGSSFWRLDIKNIHTSLVKLDWVYQAQVSRQWPNSLDIKLVEQVPIARWGEKALISQYGKIFYPPNIDYFTEYVQLTGNSLDSQKLLEKLLIFQNEFNKLNWTINHLEKRIDNVWVINFTSGNKIIVAEKNWHKQISRFMRSYPQIKIDIRSQAQAYDLRYSNGFVLQVIIE